MTTLFFATLFNFGLLVVILFWFGRKPLKAFLASRSELIATTLEEATNLSEEALRKKNEWEQKWNHANSDVKQQLEEARAALRRYRETAIAAAQVEADRVETESKLAGVGEVAKARSRLESEILQRSVDLAESHLRNNLADKDKSRLVSEYVESVSHG